MAKKKQRDDLTLDLFGDVILEDDNDDGIEGRDIPRAVLLEDEETSGGIPSSEVQGTERRGDTGQPSSGTSGQSDRHTARSVRSGPGILRSNGIRSGDSVSDAGSKPGRTVEPDSQNIGGLFADEAIPLVKAPPLRPPGTLREGHTDDNNRYHYRVKDTNDIVTGGAAKKADANILAIKLIKKIREEGRYAVPEEQVHLARYTGWGGLSQIFKTPDQLDKPWLERQESLKALVTDEEYDTMRQSVLNAHYTSPEIAKLVWDATVHMGFSGGRVLDPSTGSGMFPGTAPEIPNIEIDAVEIEPLSATIAQQLYQNANIIISGYEDFRQRENTYNLAISNVPFGSYKIRESGNNKTPGIQENLSIHDYFFAKAAYGVRPGGMIAFITSRYTMDKRDPHVRELLVNDMKMDFIGAIRLPQTAFMKIADTEVVTDIVFMQKRDHEQEPSALSQAFIETGQKQITEEEKTINQYFIDHPEMIMGKESLTGSMHENAEYTVIEDEGILLHDRISEAIKGLPPSIMKNIIATPVYEVSNDLATTTIPEDDKPEGTITVVDDTLYQKLEGEYTVLDIPAKAIQPTIKLHDLRVHIKNAFAKHQQGQEFEAREDLKKANEIYDDFIVRWGYINQKTLSKHFATDPDVSLLYALENYDPRTKTATKSALLKNISFAKERVVTHVDTAFDGLIISLSKFGAIDMPYISSLVGRELEKVEEELLDSAAIFVDAREWLAKKSKIYRTSEEYLSGNVREKLRDAQLAAGGDMKMFEQNVRELTKIIPKDLTAEEIHVKPNSPIIKEDHIKDFIHETFSTERAIVQHSRELGSWHVKFWAPDSISTGVYGTDDMGLLKIFNNMMNDKPIKIFDKITGPDDKERQILNHEKTLLANQKKELIIEEFNKWIWQDPFRTLNLTKEYNEVYNSYVNRKYTHPTLLKDKDAEVFLPGTSFPHHLRSHQLNAIWRMVTSQTTLLAHAVGAGKTLEIASAAMEMRRLGLRKKSMVVVPNHLLDQWATEFRHAYPLANILAATSEQTDDRAVFTNKIATGNWDVIIIRARTFQDIPVGVEYEEEYINERLSTLRTHYSEMMTEHGKRAQSVKDIERKIKVYAGKLDELSERTTAIKGVIPFSELGIDQLFVDEAQLFKNLEFVTQQPNIKGLGDQQGSIRAYDMHMKIGSILKKGGGVSFATGTPVSNTLVEAHTMMRYLQPGMLRAMGLTHFDEWARMFVKAVTDYELTKTGQNYKLVTRISKIMNIPELMSILNEVWDIQTASQLQEGNILVPGKNIPFSEHKQIIVDPHPLLKSYMRHLERREEQLKNISRSIKGGDNHLVIMNDGMKAAVDLKLINPAIPAYESKLMRAVKEIADRYHKFDTEKYTQVAFFNKPRMLNKDGIALFDGVEFMKKALIQAGIKEEHIGDMRKATTDALKASTFSKMNSGETRILFGSTLNLGAGTNIQERLQAIHHIDLDYRPSDIEQKNGRAIRPGNKVNNVEILYYATKGSIDTGLYDLLRIKAKSIAQIMQNNSKVRVHEEDTFTSVKNLATENPAIKKMFIAQQRLKELTVAKLEHDKNVSHAKREIQRLPGEIQKLEKEAQVIQKVIAERPDLKGDKFTMTVDGNEYSKRKDAGEVLLAQARYVNDTEDTARNIGHFAGYNITLEPTYMAGCLAQAYLEKDGLAYGITIKSTQESPGIIKSVESRAYNGPEVRYDTVMGITSDLKTDFNTYQATLKSNFNHDREIQTLTENQSQLRIEVMKYRKKEAAINKMREYDFPWEQIKEMSPRDVKDSFDKFMKSEQNMKEQLAQKQKRMGVEL